MTQMRVRDATLFVDVVGNGYPLLLMHGGPGADHWTMQLFRRCADRYTVILYDHRCNGRSTGVPLLSMTWDNLTADADALREALGFEQWAVLGHSFGGHVALEYALRFPERLSHLILLDTGGDSWWSRVNAAEQLRRWGYPPETAELANRFLNGQVAAREFFPSLLKLGGAYNPHSGIRQLVRAMLDGEWRTKGRPEALTFAARELMPGWSVMDRLGEIGTSTLVMAGRDDFIFPPEHQAELAGGIPGARLVIIDDAGHNPQMEQPQQVLAQVREFVGVPAATLAPAG